MHEGLAVGRVAGEDMAEPLPLVDALDLVGQRGNFAIVAIDASQAQDDCGNPPALAAHHLFRRHLGLRIRPFRRQFGRFVERHAGPGRGVDQHGAGVDELLDFETLQGLQQVARALHIDRFIARIGLTGEVVEGSQMNDRRQASAVALAQTAAGGGERRLDDDIGVDAVDRLPAVEFEADHGETLGQRRTDRAAEPPSRAGDQNHRFCRSHVRLLQPRVVKV